MKSIKKWFKKNKEALKFIALIFVIWQIVVAVIIFLAAKYFPSSNAYLYTERKLFLNPVWLWSRANFDGIHYLDIARRGYGIYQQAFFPLYPKLIVWLRPLFGGRNLLTGWTINLAVLYLALFFFYKLINLNFSIKVSKRALFYLLVFPTAFFLAMIYSESLFLFLVIASFYFARTKRWWLAGILGGLASATRVAGVFLFPALLVEWWQQNRVQNAELKIKKERLNLIPLLLIPLGLLCYMWFLAMRFNDPLLFVHIQPYFGAGRTGGRIILLYQVFWRYLKMLISVDKGSLTYFVVVLEFLSAVGFLLLGVFTYLRRWYAYLVFMCLVYITPSLSGTFSSMPRYVLVLFPGFILLSLGAEKYRWLRILYPILTIPLLIFCLILFTRGFWIA